LNLKHVLFVLNYPFNLIFLSEITKIFKFLYNLDVISFVIEEYMLVNLKQRPEKQDKEKPKINFQTK